MEITKKTSMIHSQAIITIHLGEQMLLTGEEIIKAGMMVMVKPIVKAIPTDLIMTIAMKEKEVVRITEIEEINASGMRESDTEGIVTEEMIMMKTDVTEEATGIGEEEEEDINTLVQIQWTQVNLVPRTIISMVGGIEKIEEVATDIEEVLTTGVQTMVLQVKMNRRQVNDVRLLL